jgi:CRP/FNR family transcriptional regulator, anaerobic regulatory protein
MSSNYSSALKNNDLTEVQCGNCGLLHLCELAGLGSNDSKLSSIVERRKIIKSAEFLYQAGDKFTGIFAVKSGMFKSVSCFDDGSEQITDFHLPGELIGLEAISKGAYLQSVIAVENSSVCDMSYEEMSMLDNNPVAFQNSVIQAISSKISLDQYQSLLIGAQSAEQRLAIFLVSIFSRLQAHEMQTLYFKMPIRNDIANYLGLAMETVCRILKSFEKNQLIENKGRKMKLCNFDEIQKLAGLVNYNSISRLI